MIVFTVRTHRRAQKLWPPVKKYGKAKSSHPHLYSAFNNVDCFKAALQR